MIFLFPCRVWAGPNVYYRQSLSYHIILSIPFLLSESLFTYPRTMGFSMVFGTSSQPNIFPKFLPCEARTATLKIFEKYTTQDKGWFLSGFFTNLIPFIKTIWFFLVSPKCVLDKIDIYLLFLRPFFRAKQNHPINICVCRLIEFGRGTTTS